MLYFIETKCLELKGPDVSILTGPLWKAKSQEEKNMQVKIHTDG